MSEKSKARALSAQRKVIRMREEGKLDTCICTHGEENHNQQKGCHIIGCRCRKFGSINVKVLQSKIEDMAKIGMSQPMNDTVWCEHCEKRVGVGHWTDPLAPQRMRNHAKEHYVPGRFRRAG